LRAGVEYVLIGERVKVPLRAGILGDRQYVETRRGDAPWFVGVSAGTGLIVGPLLFDVAYMFQRSDYTDLDDVATRVRSHRVVASLIYRHGSR
jgi:hypothetical protein